jgi:hypothetical protein
MGVAELRYDKGKRRSPFKPSQYLILLIIIGLLQKSKIKGQIKYLGRVNYQQGQRAATFIRTAFWPHFSPLTQFDC